MGELVGDGPVGGELGCCGVLTDAEAGEAGRAVHVTPSGSLDNAVAAGDGNNEDARAQDGKTAVVGGYGGSCCGDAGDDRGFRKIERAIGEVDLDGGIGDSDRVGLDDREMRAGLGVERRARIASRLGGAPKYQEGEGGSVEARGHLSVGRVREEWGRAITIEPKLRLDERRFELRFGSHGRSGWVAIRPSKR